MSIIVTQISKYGIVFGSDSNLTSDGRVAAHDKKIFEIPHINSAICAAGSYSVGGKSLVKWMPTFIYERVSEYDSLGRFAELLKDVLEQEMTTKEKQKCFIAHISGYADNHPEMWLISNTNLLEGKYIEGKNKFQISEDFWNRDWKKNKLEQVFNSEGLNYQLYVNGFTPGRIAFNVVVPFINQFFALMWQQGNFRFRPPKNMEEHEQLVRVYIQVIISLFDMSDYVPKPIGGDPQVFSIKNPSV